MITQVPFRSGRLLFLPFCLITSKPHATLFLFPHFLCLLSHFCAMRMNQPSSFYALCRGYFFLIYPAKAFPEKLFFLFLRPPQKKRKIFCSFCTCAKYFAIFCSSSAALYQTSHLPRIRFSHFRRGDPGRKRCHPARKKRRSTGPPALRSINRRNKWFRKEFPYPAQRRCAGYGEMSDRLWQVINRAFPYKEGNSIKQVSKTYFLGV